MKHLLVPMVLLALVVAAPLGAAQEGRTRSSSDGIELGDLDALGLRDFAVHVQREITRRALEVPEQFYESQRELLADPEAGVARLLYRGSPLSGEVLRRGGGAYYSFATRDHSYDRQPDLELAYDGTLSGGFYGARFGQVLDLGDRPLAGLPTDGAAPEGLDPDVSELWEFLNAEHEDTRAAGQAWHELARASGSRGRRCTAQANRTYVVRTADKDEQDHLVGFRVLARDDDGIVIAWRTLRTWSMRASSSLDSRTMADVPRADRERRAELEGLDSAGLLDLLSRIRAQAEPLLWDVPEDLTAEFARAVGTRTNFAQREGFTRLLHRGRFDPLVTLDQGGYVYSFTTDSHDWQDDPHIGLQQGRYDTFGIASWMLDLGALEFDDLQRVLADEDPSWIDEDGAAALEFLRNARLVADDRGRRRVSEEDEALARALGFDGRPVPGQLGHTYLLRSMGRESDLLVAITTLATDEVGHTIAWRVLQSFPVR